MNKSWLNISLSILLLGSFQAYGNPDVSIVLVSMLTANSKPLLNANNQIINPQLLETIDKKNIETTRTASSDLNNYIIQFQQQALPSYQGGIAGLKPTSIEILNQTNAKKINKINVKSAES